MSEYTALLVFIVANVVAASSGAFFRPGRWYEMLRKPAWRPPNWLFAPVWMVLYAMIAVSGWLVWVSAPVEELALPMSVYAIQLVLNFLWSALFFGLKRLGVALAEMALLWLSILATILLFHPINAGAAYLLIPYLLWVSFAFVLNAAMLRLNGDAPRPAG